MSLKKSFKIIGIGEILWDLYPYNKKLGGLLQTLLIMFQLLGTRVLWLAE